jgi:tyrosine-protein kinase Etk/Wzc
MQVTQTKGIQDDDNNIFKELLFKYLPYWPLFLILLLVCGLSAFLYLQYGTPIYETAATILVKDEKKGLDDSNLMEQLDLFGSKKLVENEIEVIQSRTLMREVVKNLALYAPIAQKRSIGSRSAYVFSPVRIQLRNPDSLIEQEKVYFTYDSLRQSITLANKHFPLNTWIWVNDSIGVIRFIPNPNYQAPDEKFPLYFSLVNVKTVTDDLLEAIKVTQATKLASVIDLKLKDAVPKRGEDILNGLIDEYNKAAISDKNALASNTLKFINERLRLVTSELDSVERGIQQYKTKAGITDISAQGQLYLDDVGLNDQKLSEVNVQLAVMDQVEKYVLSKNNQPGIVPSTFGVNDPVLEQLVGKLYDLEVEYQGLSKTTAENNPILVSIQNEIDKIKPNILENIQSQRKNLEAGKTNLTKTSNGYVSMLQTLPEKERKLISISRQQGIENSIYSFLLQKREETALSYNSTVADTRIVDYADSTVKPVSPKPILIWPFAVFAAFGLGMGLISIREIFNKNIVSRDEIEQYSSLPIIGEVVNDKSGAQLVLDDGKKSLVAEQFRLLRTSLSYIGINSRKKKILITSAISSEGKSFIAANLAYSLALTNKKVVLLELDLRQPGGISKVFNIDKEVGLTDYFMGNKEADHIIKRTEGNENLFIIPAGSMQPNPSELILNGRLEELLQYLDTIFDYIIIDTAPISPVTDAYILSPLCDATLFIIRHRVTPRGFVKMLDENAKMRGLKNVAIVFNGVKNKGIGRYGYSYGYGYGKEYGYRDNKKEGKKAKLKKKSS